MQHPIPNGKLLKQAYSDAVSKHKELTAQKAVYSQIKETLYAKAMEGLGAGLFLGALAAGISLLLYNATPDFSMKPDLESRATKRASNESQIVFEIEKEYPKIDFDEICRSRNLTKYRQKDRLINLLEHKVKKMDMRSVISRFVKAWVETENETGFDLGTGNFVRRYEHVIRGGTGIVFAKDNGEPVYYNDMLAEYLPHVLRNTTLDEKVIDAEDAVIWIRGGPDMMRRAQKITGSVEYSKYKDAKDQKGEFIIPYEHQLFTEMFLNRFYNSSPSNFVIKGSDFKNLQERDKRQIQKASQHKVSAAQKALPQYAKAPRRF